jgi:hypothetical protein
MYETSVITDPAPGTNDTDGWTTTSEIDFVVIPTYINAPLPG